MRNRRHACEVRWAGRRCGRSLWMLSSRRERGTRTAERGRAEARGIMRGLRPCAANRIRSRIGVLFMRPIGERFGVSEISAPASHPLRRIPRADGIILGQSKAFLKRVKRITFRATARRHDRETDTPEYGTLRMCFALLRLRPSGNASYEAEDYWTPTPSWSGYVFEGTGRRGRNWCGGTHGACTTSATDSREIRLQPRT